MNQLQRSIALVPAVSSGAAAQARKMIDAKTKPRGSLGRIETLVIQLSSIRGDIAISTKRKAVVVMAGDHGIAVEGVSAYPQIVTQQMLHNFASGGAAINVLARQMGAKVRVINMGVADWNRAIAGIEDRSIAPGTANILSESAMTRKQAVMAIESGIEVVGELVKEGIDVLAGGEMGIGNTTSSSALIAYFLGLSAEIVTGRGTGIEDNKLQRKIELVARIVDLHAAEISSDPIEALARLGGFEIAGLVGLIIGAAQHRLPMVLDGFITGAAALVATRLCPRVTPYLIASHRSREPGHKVVLQSLALDPLLDLDLRLGEGTGAVLAFPLLDAATHILGEMATFESAGVSDSGV